MAVDIPSYHLLNQLGEGAMAEVWLAEHKRNGRKAAIKILKPSATAENDFEKLFLREGQVLAGFDHPNIVKIYDNDRVGDLAFLVMEYLPGGTLLDRMRRAPISIGEAIGLIAQVASGLDAAHRQQVIHRDLKPANIMLRDETTPVLTDFGAVRVLDRSTIYGKEGLIVGTPIYMSPEQISGQTLSGSSDLYALGVIFYELLTGERPFPGMSVAEIASNHLYAPIPSLAPAIAMLQPVIDRLLAKKAADRYASAQAFVDELRALFIHDEALRLQVGYSGTSMAWSSQLRALGFVLDAEQKNEVRRAQGDYLNTQLAGTGQPRPGAALADTAAATPPPVNTGGAAVAPTQRRWAPALAAGALMVSALGAFGWWYAQRPPATVAVPITQPVAVQPRSPSPAASDPATVPAVAVPAPVPAPAAPTPPTAADDEAAALAEAIAGITALELSIRYTAQADGTVLDTQSRLTWASADNGADADWYDARKHCEALGAGWQLPSAEQLLTLYDASGTLANPCGDATCRVTPLITLSGGFHWSSSQEPNLRAVVIDLGSGQRRPLAIVNPFGLRALCLRVSAKD